MTSRRLLRGCWIGFACLGGTAVALPAAELTLEVEPRWRGVALTVPSPVVINEAGQSLRITRAAALVSDVVLWREDGSQVRLAGQHGFWDAGNGRRSFTMREVPDGAYVGLEFAVGVPPELNHADPGRWPADHALNPLVNGLHWSWQGGYVFAALEGHWSAAGDAAMERGFSYHLATDARAMRVGFQASFEVRGPLQIRLAWDLARVLGPLALRTDDGSESTHSAAGDMLAARLATAVERSWFWLGAERQAEENVVAGPVASGSAGAPARSAPIERSAAAALATTPVALVVPAGFPQPALPADNPLTQEGIALGRHLFFEPRLSAHGTQSCASCHDPARAFSDSVALSRGVEGSLGRRNAMPLFNLAWSPGFAWDGSQARVRDQALAAWRNPIEMNAAPEAAVAALAADPALAGLVQATFGTPELTVERVLLALEQFLLVQVAADSKFDRARRGAAELSEEEQRGFELFATEYDPARGRRGADCFHCHGGALLADGGFKNNGLDREPADPGRAGATGLAADRGKFKTPSLRNVALTAPYMHDGRFATLEAVVAHYDHGVQRSATLDPNLAKHPAGGLALSEADQRALVAFLRTLTESARPETSYSSPSQ